MIDRRGRRVALTESVIAAIAIGAVLGATALVGRTTASAALLAYWMIGALVLCLCLVAFVVGRRYRHLPVADGRVLCIVPVYNEPAEILRATIDALCAQTVPVDIVVIDDGSATPVTPTTNDPRVRWWSQHNTGKRGAQVAVLRRVVDEGYEFILTVDSDSQPAPDACQELLRAMSNPKVQAATGMIYVRNSFDSWVSMAADMDIGGSCVMMRASRSYLGALETTSGALALYRADLLYDHLDAYAVECGTGDDRWLALRALRRGEVVGVAEAAVHTEMPTTLGGTYRQRLRWARSWWWMLPYVFRHLGPRQLVSPVYGIIQLLVSPVVVAVSAITLFNLWRGTAISDASALVLVYVVTYLVVRYCVAALYLVARPNLSWLQKVVLLVVGTPAAVILNLILLTPTRYWALVRLFDNRWQTRHVDPNAIPATRRG